MKKIFKKIAFFSFFLAIAASVVALIYFERGSFSESDLRVEIRGPEEVEVGEIVDYSIIYRNNSDIKLENVSVTFEYPHASVPVRDEEDVVEERESLRVTENLEDLNPGEEEIIEFKGKIFGEEGDSVVAKAWFEYSPQNLSAQYEVERTHTGIITEVPINFEFDLPNQKEAGEEFPFRVRYFSQLDQDLDNLGIRLNYPGEFEFLRSTPQGLENNEWERSLPSNQGGLIEVFGKLNGDPGDIKGFTGELGVWKFDRFISLKKINGEVLIPQPNLFVDVLVNDSADYIANPGEDLLYDIYFKNIGDQVMENLFLTIDLDTDILDMDETESMGGRFQKEAGSIIWSHSSFPELRRLAPNEEEKISFWTQVKEEDLPYNPEAVISINLEQVRQEKRTKVNTDINFDQRFSIRDEDPFNSSGPLPLSLNNPSTYTITWEIDNLYNDLKNVRVESTLPEDAGIVESEYSEYSEFDYNSTTGEIVWSLDEIERGAGASHSSPTLSFQVEIIPTASAEGDVELLGETELRATDNWTNEDLSREFESLTHGNLLEVADIRIDSDPVEFTFEEGEKNDEDDENESN